MKRIARILALAALSAALALPPAFAGSGLPKAATPAEVSELMARPQAGLEIVDIRPSAEYADYALPGSFNLDPAAVMADETLLSGNGPLLIVDKDGTDAFAVAGVLARKSSRPVMALSGGLAAWWADKEMGVAVKAVPLDSAPAQAPAKSAPQPAAPAGTQAPAAPQTPAQPSPAPAAPQAPASKNAGC